MLISPLLTTLPFYRFTSCHNHNKPLSMKFYESVPEHTANLLMCYIIAFVKLQRIYVHIYQVK